MALEQNYQSLMQAMEEVTPWFQENIESITDPLKFLEFQKRWDKKALELFHLLVGEFNILRGKTPKASLLWMPPKNVGQWD